MVALAFIALTMTMIGVSLALVDCIDYRTKQDYRPNYCKSDAFKKQAKEIQTLFEQGRINEALAIAEKINQTL